MTSSQPTNLKCVIAPNTDGEVQTNYHVSLSPGALDDIVYHSPGWLSEGAQKFQ